MIFHAHAFRDATGETFEQRDHLIVEAVIIAEQNFGAGGGGTRDEYLFGRRLNRENIIFVFQQHN